MTGALIGLDDLRQPRLAGLGPPARHVRLRVDRVAARPRAQGPVGHRRGAWRPAGSRQRDREHGSGGDRRGRRAHRRRRRRRAAGIHRGAGGGRQRYHRQRDRQGVGAADVVGDVAGARTPRHLGRDVAGRHGRRRGRGRRPRRGGDRARPRAARVAVGDRDRGDGGIAAGKLARSDAGSPWHSQQRHAELHQHRRRGRRCRRRWPS